MSDCNKIISATVNNKSLDILESVNLSGEHPSVLERYYKARYCLSVDGSSVDHHCLLFHSNRICLLTIAKGHPVLKLKKDICRINCNVGHDVDRMKNKVSGKSKRGGQQLKASTVLCQLECTDGTSYDIFSCIKGKLIEMNPNVIANPNLLVEKPYTNGHIAILLSDISKVEEYKSSMLSEDEYNKILFE